MRAQRIKTGFHRLGLVLAAICAVWALGCITYWLYYGVIEGLYGAVGAIVVALLIYLLAWALGWIIAGFAGDGEAGK